MFIFGKSGKYHYCGNFTNFRFWYLTITFKRKSSKPLVDLIELDETFLSVAWKIPKLFLLTIAKGFIGLGSDCIKILQMQNTRRFYTRYKKRLFENLPGRLAGRPVRLASRAASRTARSRRLTDSSEFLQRIEG
jgi:hypothetical protein